jgi:hypothetical protein
VSRRPSRAALRRVLLAVVLVLLLATPVALGAFAKKGVYATSKFKIAFLVNANGTALRNGGMNCKKPGFLTVVVFFQPARTIGRHGAFAYKGSAITEGGGKSRLTFSGRFVSKKKAVGVISSPACYHGKRVHFTALYRGN